MDCKDHGIDEPSWACQCTRIKIENMEEALNFAHGAILDAICSDDGLDGEAGDRVARMIEKIIPSLAEIREKLATKDP